MSRILDPTRDGTIVTALNGFDASATILTLVSGQGVLLPDTNVEGMFTLSCYNSTDYTAWYLDPDRERIRVTVRAGDLLTVTRGVDGTTPRPHNIVGKTYKMLLAWSRQDVEIVETELQYLTTAAKS